ncbi:trans-acting enoyl reductase family protein [Catellatospora sp. TT07R-123]|uniref:saccharopine dehydrogenase family protein n=1 Tax=Catellatospora sp. TT07R-123 TaxID=2733863 RepID=UPI001BB33B0C|nr:saccharopine dehydrogenase NADP-binding domain-containing protein [Catellatospora sp. TT07R-123]
MARQLGQEAGRGERDFDLVLFGATGFTGGLTAEYLAAHAPQGCRWALAGRDRARLAAVRERLAAIDPACADVPLLPADASDPDSLRELARRARVVVTTVGPYVAHGEPLVAACAEAGTDYVDLTGEPEFIDRMFTAYHERAVASGARIVHACGFDSVPHDLGAYYTVGLLPADAPIRLDGYVRAKGTVSGGTLASALTAFARRRQTAAAARGRRRLEQRLAGPGDRKVRTPLGRLRRARGAKGWAVPLPTVDAAIVGRSARALDRYGPDFRYRHAAAVRWLPVALAGLLGAAVLLGLAQVGPIRRALSRLRRPGTGPDAATRERSWFSVRFVGEGGGRRVVTEVRGGDPGYGETAKMLAESALCLAFDELPPTSGQVTTAVAMGDALLARLTAAGLTFRTVEPAGVGGDRLIG